MMYFSFQNLNKVIFGDHKWGLNFNPALIPGVTTFTPVIGLGLDSSYWTGPGIVSQQPNLNYADIVLDEPGFYDYTFEVTNNFSCTFDTTVTVEVIQGPENAFLPFRPRRLQLPKSRKCLFRAAGHLLQQMTHPLGPLPP